MQGIDALYVDGSRSVNNEDSKCLTLIERRGTFSYSLHCEVIIRRPVDCLS